MKKTILVLSTILLPVALYAQQEENGAELIYEEAFYGIKISPNGQYVGNCSSDAGIYNVATGEVVYYDEAQFGAGNCLANNGMGVGSINDKALVLLNGKNVQPLNYTNYGFCNLNGITPDASKVVGVISNPVRGLMYVPFIADIDANGNLSEPEFLPCPTKDLFDATPLYATAIWVSDDGKVAAGQVLDSMGYFAYPIVYTQGSDGKWDYYLPSESTFNPTGIKLPLNPWENEPEYPTPEDFMSGALKQAYQEAYEAYRNGLGPEPDPTAYMTDEEYWEYEIAVNEYNDWFFGSQSAIDEYIDIYNEILSTSPSFSFNDFALQPNGSMVVQSGGVINSKDEMETELYKFDITTKTFTKIALPQKEAAPKQVLSDGTIIVCLPINVRPEVNINPNTWFLRPGSSQYLTVQDYLRPDYPEFAEYIEKDFSHGNGIVAASNDLSVISSGLTVLCRSDYSYELDAPFYSTYIITGLRAAGVESIADTPEAGIYRVFNLQGVKLLETKEAQLLNTLGNGVYIVNGKKILISK